MQLALPVRCAGMRCDVHLAGGHVGPSLEFSVSHDRRVSEGIGWVLVGVSDSVVRGGREGGSRAVGGRSSYANEKGGGGARTRGSSVFILFLVDVFQKSKLH
jgi:hypothetical protein